MKNRVLQYDFETLPEVPFSVYFSDKKGQVSPKRMYTVTRKAINYQHERIDLFIQELGQNVTYRPDLISRVYLLHVN